MKIFSSRIFIALAAFFVGGAGMFFATGNLDLKPNLANAYSSAPVLPSVSSSADSGLNNLKHEGKQGLGDTFTQLQEQMNKHFDQDAFFSSPGVRDSFNKLKQMQNDFFKDMGSSDSLIDRFFGSSENKSSMFGDFPGIEAFSGFKDLSSTIELSEKEDGTHKYIEIKADGIKKDNLKIELVDGMISVKGEVQKQSKGDYGSSNFVSSFQRSFPVPFGVDESKMSVDTNENIIILKFPRFSS